MDSEITALEETYSSVIHNLRQQQGSACHGSIPTLVAHLCARTRQLRESVTESFDEMAQELLATFERENVLESALLQSPGIKTMLRKAGVKGQDARTVVRTVLAPLLPTLLHPLMEQWRQFRPEWRQAVRSSHLRSLRTQTQNPHSGARVQGYEQMNWHVVRTSDLLILGDSACVFETTGERRFKPIDDVGDDVLKIYLPISSTRCIVATHLTVQPSIDVRALNEAAARCSMEYFISSTRLPGASVLPSQIGKWSGVLTLREKSRILNALKKDLRTWKPSASG